MKEQKYYLGLDIGTDSVGYAVTDTSPEYKLLKHGGEPMWGVTLFDAAATKAERRTFRTSRRRLKRRQTRVALVQEIFAAEIAKVDPKFYQRIRESALLRKDAAEPYCLFNDKDYTDKDYHKQYPTIHHLIVDLMKSDGKHDVRLVYIACAWLVAHRGHFLKELSPENVDKVTDFDTVYRPLIEYFDGLSLENYARPWVCEDEKALANAIRKNAGVKNKSQEIASVLFNGEKCPKGIADKSVFPFSVELIIKLIAGGTVKLKDLYEKDDYADIDPSSVSLGMDEEKLDLVLAQLGDDGELICRLKEIYDWSILCGILGENNKYISVSKIKEYDQHKKDLRFLKSLIKKHAPEKYDEVFKNIIKTSDSVANYVSYSGNAREAKGDRASFSKAKDPEVFFKYIKKIVERIEPSESEKKQYEDMVERLSSGTFMPKQVTGENRVIPYQLYYKELELILEKASSYLPFLKEKDEDGYITKDKLLSIMKFRVPYYVGPLNDKSPFAWLKRKAEGRILPWNFEEKVDLDESERRFIKRMTNDCTYLPGEKVLPKHSLLYEKFEVLNEINKIKINGVAIDVKAKQSIYEDLFMQKKKVSVKMIRDHLAIAGFCTREDAETLSGIDTVTVKSSLSSHFSFRRLLSNKTLNENQVEDIIEHSTYSEDSGRFRKWLKAEYPFLSNEDANYICSLKFKDFGRLSKAFLTKLEGADIESGEVNNVIGFLWDKNVVLMELLSSKYSFGEIIENTVRDYYEVHPKTLDERLDEMYISNSVKRPIHRTLEIVRDVVKATGKAPEKIFIEMARGGEENSKGKRTKSRKQQILELYEKVRDEDISHLHEQLEAMGDGADARLQSEMLFLYYIQFGKCMYSGEPIDIERLSDGTYNIDHIYPRTQVKDDSVLNNKVLVLSTLNMEKSDDYPLPSEWRSKMYPFWKRLKEIGAITEEKFDRLTRKTRFTDEEAWGFINRQIVETRQSTKAVATILKEKYPNTEIVYVKAGIVSDFRHEYALHKCRSVNDLHHAKDAYLNVVCGSVYTKHFSHDWFSEARRKNEKYNLKLSALLGEIRTRTKEFKTPEGAVIRRNVPVTNEHGDPVFSGRVVKNGSETVWNGSESFYSVRKRMMNNNVHTTKYSYCRKGGLFDQNPLRAAEGLIPRKAGLEAREYGGYNKASVSFFFLVKYFNGKTSELMLLPVESMHSGRVVANTDYAVEYVKERIHKLTKKTAENVSFPFGMRQIKINTVLSVNGFEYTLSGITGSQILLSPFTQLKLPIEWEEYVKRIESVNEKIRKNASYRVNFHFDQVSSEKNIELYDLLKKKHSSGVFSRRINSPAKVLESGKDTFTALLINDQITALISILQTFGKTTNGVDLTAVNGAAHASKTLLQQTLSNWKKTAESAYLVDRSDSGIWEKRSVNLLDLL